MILVDTGCLLALLDRKDSMHDRARAWAAFDSDKLLVTEFVLLETVNFCSKSSRRAKAHVLVNHVLSSPGFEVIEATTELLRAGLVRHARHTDKEWSLTDCISFTVMEERQLTRALAHDHHFEQAGFEALLRRDPV